MARSATGVGTWFLLDAGQPQVPAGVTSVLAVALRAGYRAVLHDEDGDHGVQPLGLVLAPGGWVLVHLAPGGPAARSLAGVRTAAVVQRPVARPPGFDLAEWHRRYRLGVAPGPPRRSSHSS